ncbi:hypothetical protein [Nocardia nova]
MEPVASSSTFDLLEQFHTRLDGHFTALQAARTSLGDSAPVFALEHDLSAADLALLQSTVRAAIAQGFSPKHCTWWLPFVVYAAESGYTYTGKEYWQTFADQTPMWDHYGDHDRIRSFFVKFADAYGGIVPKGAFADNFGIIAWPIANAVMPTSLQRDLARVLHEFESGLTPELLANPAHLGKRLAARSGGYTEQFRIFCSNVTLLGSVAAALLSHEGDESPYLISSTLARIVESLSGEQKARRWLESARRAATRVRAQGFVHPSASARRPAQPRRLPMTTDPRVTLRRQDGIWRAFAAFPDLTVLGAENPDLHDELRTRRAKVDGAERAFLSRGWLVHPGLNVRLSRWPAAERPLLQLENSREIVNTLLAARCALSPGPTWLFRHRDSALATEIKGKVVRPGGSYVLVIRGDDDISGLGWVKKARAEIDDAQVFEISVPSQVGDVDIAALRRIGLGVISDISIRPVGLIASAWDGEGGVEWLPGEPGILAIGTQLEPGSCVLEVDGEQHRVVWTPGEREQFIVLNDFTLGTHELCVTLLSSDSRPIVQETVLITAREPQVRPDTAAAGEGIRLIASPAWPSLSELFDGRAELTIDGPVGAADVDVTLRSESGEVLTKVTRQVKLPLTSDQWLGVAESLRKKIERQYDDAESARLEVSRSGIGFASLRCDRGFKPLRWRMVRQRNGSHVAHLIDRTDRLSTIVELFTVESPLQPIRYRADEDILVPALGGLLCATAGDAHAATLLPTEPMRVFESGGRRPVLAANGRTPQELIAIAGLWKNADLPGDPFARAQQEHVLDAITRLLMSVTAGTYWARLERRLAGAKNLAEYVDAMQSDVGITRHHKALAAAVASHLWEWSEPGAMLTGFSEVIAPTLAHNGMAGQPAVARFLLLLAGRPWQLAGWDPAEVASLLRGVTTLPVLIRAARFAVLGTRAFKEVDEEVKGF